MRLAPRVFTTFLLITGIATPILNAAEVVRYVDMSEIFKNYYKTVRSQASLKKQEEIYKQRAEELTNEIKELRKKRDALEEKSLNIAVEEETRNKNRRQAQATENLYQAKQKQLRSFLQKKQQELRGKYLEMRKDLVDEILDFIREHAEEQGIDTVMDVSGLTNNLLPTIIHYPKDKEITDGIITQLNKGHEDEVPDNGVEGVESPDLTTD